MKITGSLNLEEARPKLGSVLHSASTYVGSNSEMPQDCKTRVHQITLAAGLLRGKWKLQILCSMRSGPVRLSQLTRLFPSASKKALRAALRDLERAGIATRRDLSNKVLHVEYDIAVDMKETMYALLDCLTDWAKGYELKSISSQ